MKPPYAKQIIFIQNKGAQTDPDKNTMDDFITWRIMVSR